MTKRIQRKRTKGWKMPANTVYVGRPTKWGNPFLVDDSHTPEYATGQYRLMMEQPCMANDKNEVIAALRGKDLACWCPLDQPCHADVLLEIANTDSGR